MNKDRGTIRGPRTAQILLTVLVAVAVVALGSVVSTPAASAGTGGGESAAAWPAHWSEYTQVDGTPIGDVSGDVTPSTVDLVSGACAPCAAPASSVAWASDGNNAFFRIRLGADPLESAERESLEEAFLVQIADKSGQVRAVVGVNRTDAHQSVYVSDAVGDVVIKVHESSRNARVLAASGVRVVRAADGSSQFFLDFQVPLSLLATVSGGAVTESTPIRLYYGSSAAADLTTKDLAAITGDFMLGDATAVDFSTSATVRLAAPQHQVTFDSAGGTDTAFQTVAEGFAAARPASPVRTGHEFTGWFTSTADGPAYDFSAPVVGATTVHAQWSPDSYLVTFDSAGGSPVADRTVPYGNTVAVKADPTRDDDTFLGWYTASTGGKPVDLGTREVTGRTALYAHWRVSPTEEGPDPVVEDAAPPVVSDPTAVIPAPTDPRSSSDFDTRGGSEQQVDSGPIDTPAPPTGTTNSVVFFPNGGSAVDSQTVAAGDTAAVPAEPTRAGYAFAGWFASPDGGQEWDFSDPIDEMTTLYAHWTRNAGGVPEEPGDGAGDPDGDTNCSDYATSAEATAAMGALDPDGLDRDNDGVACEDSLPAVDSGDTGDDDTGDEEHGGGAALPNTGNQVPQALVPAAVVLLLIGFVLMTWDRRRSRGAPGPA